MDTPACTSTVLAQSSILQLPVGFHPGSRVPILLLRLFRKLRQLKGLQRSELCHTAPCHDWGMGAPWSHSERCPAPEEPWQGIQVDPTWPNIQSRNKAETIQQPSRNPAFAPLSRAVGSNLPVIEWSSYQDGASHKPRTAYHDQKLGLTPRPTSEKNLKGSKVFFAQMNGQREKVGPKLDQSTAPALCKQTLGAFFSSFELPLLLEG